MCPAPCKSLGLSSGRVLKEVPLGEGGAAAAALGHHMPAVLACRRRQTAQIVAQSLGRPISATTFRDPSLAAVAAARLGWSKQYYEQEDLEAERLFDYGLLAPPLSAGG